MPSTGIRAWRYNAHIISASFQPGSTEKGLMKTEYDFSQGRRGQFFRPDARFNLPDQPSEAGLAVHAAG